MASEYPGIDEIRQRLEELVSVRLASPLSEAEQKEWDALTSAETAFLAVQFG